MALPMALNELVKVQLAGMIKSLGRDCKANASVTEILLAYKDKGALHYFREQLPANTSNGEASCRSVKNPSHPEGHL